MKERCRDGCRTSLLIAGVVLVPAIFHTLLPPCHPYITTHFMEMIFSTCHNKLAVAPLCVKLLEECNALLACYMQCIRQSSLALCKIMRVNC